MEIDDPRITELKAIVTALNDEFDLVTVFHEVWKPTSSDEALHRRMSHSYGGQAFLVIRTALRREMMLALARIWDTNKQSARMSKVAALLREKGLVEALALERATRIRLPEASDAMQTDLEGRAREVVSLVNRYAEGGSRAQALKGLLELRNERLAHRQLALSAAPVGRDLDEGVEQIYGDSSKLIAQLMGLANATAYDPAETAMVFGHYAAKFWSGVHGDRADPEPK